MAHKKRDVPEGTFIPAGLLIGLGVGFIVHNIPAGLLIGLGSGFLLFALFGMLRKRK